MEAPIDAYYQSFTYLPLKQMEAIVKFRDHLMERNRLISEAMRKFYPTTEESIRAISALSKSLPK